VERKTDRVSKLLF